MCNRGRALNGLRSRGRARPASRHGCCTMPRVTGKFAAPRLLTSSAEAAARVQDVVHAVMLEYARDYFCGRMGPGYTAEMFYAVADELVTLAAQQEGKKE